MHFGYSINYLEKLRFERKEKLGLKKKYEDNLDNIETNKLLDSKILGYNTKISNLIDTTKFNRYQF